jgi:DNA-binding NarL/FixJ family response regulator
MTIANGGSYMSPVIARKVVDYFNPSPKSGSDKLTAKEEQIVKGLVDGLSYKMIAARLGLSIDTVRFHIRNIYAKLGVNSKTEVVSKSFKGEIG